MNLTLNIGSVEITLDASLEFTENGVRFNMKKFNVNNFVIDKVFKSIDKETGAKNNKLKDKHKFDEGDKNSKSKSRSEEKDTYDITIV